MLKRLKWAITIFFLTLGLLTLAAYMKLGHERRDREGSVMITYPRRAGAVTREKRVLQKSKNSKHETQNSKQESNDLNR